MKTKKESSTMKEKVETPNKKSVELAEEELGQVTGGIKWDSRYHEARVYCPTCNWLQTIRKLPAICENCGDVLEEFMF